jgi:hypothetical protein
MMTKLLVDRTAAVARRLVGEQRAAFVCHTVFPFTTGSGREGRCCLSTSAGSKNVGEGQAPSSFSHDRMAEDKRYRGSAAIPESLLSVDAADTEFSIRGKFREGRAAYLDMSATTPLDPRVLDAMAPYMVRCLLWLNWPGTSRTLQFFGDYPLLAWNPILTLTLADHELVDVCLNSSCHSDLMDWDIETDYIWWVHYFVRCMVILQIGSYGNPHSRTHAFGWEAERVVEKAREQVANLIGASAKEIIFTSGATESNNLSIKGAAHFYKKRGKHIITAQTEHKCVLDSCRSLESEGYDVTYLPVQHATGRIDMDELKAAIREDTILISIMAVNNEIGTLQPLAEIGELCRSKKIIFHCDAAQMLGKLPISVDELKVDLMSLSSHKVYGPKGIGALYVRRRPRVRLEPLFSGGGQERYGARVFFTHDVCIPDIPCSCLSFFTKRSAVRDVGSLFVRRIRCRM